MKSLFFKSRFWRADIPLFLLTVTTWMAIFSIVPPGEGVTRVHLLVFSIGAGTLTQAFLHVVGYYSIFRLLPRKSCSAAIATSFRCRSGKPARVRRAT